MKTPGKLAANRSAGKGSCDALVAKFAAWLDSRTGSRVAPLMFMVVAMAAISPAAIAADEPAKATSASCLECHSDAKLSTKRDGHEVSLFVDEKTLPASAHKSLECVDCHDKYDGDASPHRSPPAPVDCFGCHEDAAKKHGFHGKLAALKSGEQPVTEGSSCVRCHGSHATAAVKSPNFSFADGAQVQACGKCHYQEKEHFVASAHGRAFATHEQNAPDCLTCHRDPIVPPTGEKAALSQKLTQTKQCESCHVGKENVVKQALRGNKFVESFDHSVHGAALQKGEAKAANCVDCHGAHEMNRAMAANARVNKLHVAATCAQCHQDRATEFNESVHAKALRRGNLDSPACTDCHGEHEILAKKDPTSPVHDTNVAQQVCANCHASLKLTRKYGIAANTFSTFSDSFHGLAVRGGSVEVVNCASCHSSHAIKSQNDPASTISKQNLAHTCGKCHPGANTRFTVGKVHVSPDLGDGGGARNDPVLYLIATIYVALILVVVGGMFLHNLLDFVKKVRRKLAIQKGLIEEEHVAHRLFLRMTAHERVQHGILVLSFVTLVVTGFMLRYPEAWWVVGIRNLSSKAFEWRSWLHRFAGVVMIVAGVWHVLYLTCTKPGRSLLRDLLPKWRDITDPIGVLKYNLGLAATKPAFGRFSYIEKAEYWALVWGTVLMGVTGAILWFENTSIGLFTKLGFDISRTIHFYEAILATLAIIVWHFYFVIFNPDIYPMNLAWLTGRMSEKEMAEEHPLELARLKGEEAKAAEQRENKDGGTHT